MSDGPPNPVRLYVPWATIFKVLGALMLVWVWLELLPIVMVVLVALVLAVTLEPLVQWLERRRVKRGPAVVLIGALTLIIIAAGLAAAATPISDQSTLLLGRVAAYRENIAAHAPAPVARVLRRGADIPTQLISGVLSNATTVGGALLSAAAMTLFAFILTLYLLADGRRTFEWVIAYVPPAHRPRTDETIAGVTDAIFAYVVGNVITSLFAAAFVFASLTWLKVPAPFILAVIAGVCDFVPILGFFVALAPAVLLALTISVGTAVAVVGMYGLCHVIENYAIAPKVYGNRLKLSGVAVLLGLVVGAELGGIIGALLALPVIAAYPIVERIWLKNYLGRAVLAEHARLEREEE
jgi:predicted PurR-regulated permease PerM